MHSSTIVRHIALFIVLLGASSSAQSFFALHPSPKASYALPGTFRLSRQTALVTPLRPSAGTARAIGFLQAIVRSKIGDTLQVLPEAELSGRNAILIGERDSYDVMKESMRDRAPRGESVPPQQGYILHADAGRILLAGTDGDGTFNAVSTLAQLLTLQGGEALVPGCRIWDAPDYPIRWSFVSSNLRGANAIGLLRTIADTMAMRKFNGMQHSDFKYGILQQQPPNYFDSLRAFRRLADERNLEIVPGVMPIGYSSAITYTDPHLAEGVPTTAEYVIEADTGRLLADSRVALPNGGFESVSNGQFTGWNFYDGPNVSIVADDAVFHGGSRSARCENFRAGNSAGNARFNRLVSCRPFRHYVMTAWIKTSGLSADDVKLLAMGQDSAGAYRVLTFTAWSVPATTAGWMRVEVSFNTLTYSKVLLYAGVWGGNAGTIWWDDIAVHEGGLANVLRRAGTPLRVTDARSGRAYAEGVDFSPVSDPVMESRRGNYGPYHGAPTFRRIATGSIRNGDTVRVSSYHPLTTVAGTDGNGSVMVCVSEDTLYRILEDQIARIDTAYAPSRFFMEHDEIRSMNWDDACQRRGLSPASLLADNVRRCAGIIDAAHPGAEIFVWSDMFDSTHNAHDEYYLVNGDLSGVWHDVPRSLVIANWNGGKARQSLEFFSRLGFRQIASPYYDVGNTSSIRAWRRAMNGVPGVLGAMYTTWQNDYRFQTAFADYFWTGGPAIDHTPLDSAAGNADPVRFDARFSTDRYNASDAVASAFVDVLDDAGTVLASSAMLPAGDAFSVSLSPAQITGNRYRIRGINSYGIETAGPSYDIRTGITGVDTRAAAPGLILGQNYPNPASGGTAIPYHLPAHGSEADSKGGGDTRIVLQVFDLFGRLVATPRVGEPMEGWNSVVLDTSTLPAGVYVYRLRASGRTLSRIMRIVR
ncbi:MAG: hypothetical protein IPP94_04820 [Ignavibacteria bacterium]|nr:hypothetical protein [Ignavibacteria bacterium]